MASRCPLSDDFLALDQGTTALGAAMLAGLAVGFWSSQQELAASWGEERHVLPSGDAAWRKDLLEKWDEAVRRA